MDLQSVIFPIKMPEDVELRCGTEMYYCDVELRCVTEMRNWDVELGCRTVIWKLGC